MKTSSYTITILGKPVLVTEKSETEMHGLAGSSNGTAGCIDLLSSLRPDEKAETLLHEIIHQVDHALQLSFEEETVHRLSVGLYAAGVRPPSRPK